MRSDNTNFADAWGQNSIQAQFVFKIDFGGNDFIYLTSAVINGLSGATVYSSVITDNISGTSQKISPEKSLSTIGEIRFSALDAGLTELQKTKLDAGKGLRGKRVVFYVGEAGVAWSDFVVATTQVIKTVEYADGVYSFACADVQRELRREIFDVKKTGLSASIAANATTIPVYGTTGFQLVRQPLSPSGIIDSPGALVGYIKLSNGCIVRYTGVTANSFTGCVWGVLDTMHLIAPIDKDGDSNADNAPKVEEYIYREGPAVMLAYELITGACWGFPGETLPDHWHMGIPTSLVRTADFQLIGADWWDTADHDKGIAAVISGVTKTDGKKFIEEQIYTMLGAFSPIYANGEIGLRRLSVVHSSGSYVRLISERDVTDAGSLTHDMDSVINQISIRWNYVPEKKEYTRLNMLRDTVSISQHGTAKPKELAFKTLASSRHSYDVLRTRFDSLRDRFAGPPLRIKVRLLPKHNDLEVGDVIRLQLPNVKDYTGSITSLDRNFEIQQIGTDWKTGEVSLDLFGSSQPASPVSSGSGNEPAVALNDSWYTSSGIEIKSANFPGAITMVGGLTRISSDITLTGTTHGLRRYYCNGDLTIDAGVTVTITNNVMIAVKGFFQVNGKIDGKGRGRSGQTSVDNLVSAEYIGNTFSGWGLTDTAVPNHDGEYDPFARLLGLNKPSFLQGRAYDYAPYSSFSTADGVLSGLPFTLMGSPGPRGGNMVLDHTKGNFWLGLDNTFVTSAEGGAGGASGAGLAIVARGADIGASGVVDTSGLDGLPGQIVKTNSLAPTPFFGAGSGSGGFCGAVYWLIDGATNNAPSLNNSNSKAEVGMAPTLANGRYDINREQSLRHWLVQGVWSAAVTEPIYSHIPGTYTTRENTYQVNHRIQFLTGEAQVSPDIGPARTPAAIILSEATNTPPTQSGNLSTIEASVTPPVGDSNYSYSFISYRKVGDIPWLDVGPAAPEIIGVVPSDGSTYEVRAQSVNKQGQRSEAYISDTITVSNIETAFSAILTLPVPAIQLKSGLTTFSGRDAHFLLTDTAYQSEHFAYYEIKVYNGTTLLRTEQISDRAWSYTSEKNLEDGNHRTFAVKVSAVSVRGNKTAETSLTVSNPAPTTTLNSIVAGFKIVKIYMTPITDSDFKAWRIYGSTVSGFTPGPDNLVYEGTSNPITIDGLTDGTTYYYRIQATDEFGDGNMDVQRSVTTEAALSFEYGDGELEAGEVMTVNGNIVVERGTTRTVIGPVDQGPYYSLMHTKLGDSVLFDVRESGTVTIGDTLSNNYMLWDQIAGTLTVRGNISATSVAASALISAPEITGGTISAAVLSGGSISGTTITGSTIRTRASGSRAEMAENGSSLICYDSNNFRRVLIDPVEWTIGMVQADGSGLGSTSYGMISEYCGYGFRAAECTRGALLQGSVYGAKGDSTTGNGIEGSSGSGYGVYGTASSGIGVRGEAVHGGWFVGSQRGVHGQGQYGGYLVGSIYDAFLGGTGTAGSFTGAHDALMAKAAPVPEIGDIVTVIGIAGRSSVSSTIPYVAQSTTRDSKAAYGVVSSINTMPAVNDAIVALSTLDDTEYALIASSHDYLTINGIGEGQINVCDAGGDLEIGDFISTSSVPGKGQRYDGNDMRVVVAKCLELVDWSAEPQTTKMVACVYMCG